MVIQMVIIRVRGITLRGKTVTIVVVIIIKNRKKIKKKIRKKRGRI